LVTGFQVRALRYFKGLGIRVECVMTDNGAGYVSGPFNKACRILLLRHLPTQPYTPRPNGKAERFIQTLVREWAYALALPQLRQARRRPAEMAAPLQPQRTPG
jgi:transposase InsO family protein